MRQVTPEFYDLAGQLLAHEAGEDRNPARLIEAAQRSCGRLGTVLVRIFGPDGFDALLTQSLRRAKTVHPFLRSVEVEVHAGGCLKGIDDSLRRYSTEEIEAALAAFLAHIIWLLSRLIGKELVLRQVHRSWPDFPLDSALHGVEEAKG